jgi:hypothetical protein
VQKLDPLHTQANIDFVSFDAFNTLKPQIIFLEQLFDVLLKSIEVQLSLLLNSRLVLNSALDIRMHLSFEGIRLIFYDIR